MTVDRQAALADVRRVVIKLGSAVLAREDGTIDLALIASLAEQVAALRARGIDVILVSSGAMRLGLAAVQMGKLPESVTDGQMLPNSFLDALIGCVVGAGLLYLTALFSLFVLKKEGMGGGDIKLLGMVGAFLGWKLALMTIVLGSVVGSVVGVTLILLGRHERGNYIPFGPYLALGALVSMMWGDALMHGYLKLMFGEDLSHFVMLLPGM